jgi:hypothetical protein
VTGFGAIAVGIFPLIAVLIEGLLKPALCLLNVFGYFGQVADFKRGTILLDDGHKGHAVEKQFVVFHLEFICGKIKGLLNEVDVFKHVGKSSLKRACDLAIFK